MMPSGNAIYTYTGPGESTEVQGQIFLKDQPKHITDQGVIAVCAGREDFEAFNASRDSLAEDVRRRSAMLAESKAKNDALDERLSAKPKKAKSK